MTITFERAKEWAAEIGAKVMDDRHHDEIKQCWIDRIEWAAISGDPDDVEEANRYAGAVILEH